jgi:hypothetical protein
MAKEPFELRGFARRVTGGDDAERFRLIGTYRTPRFRYGRKVLGEFRSEVTIIGKAAGSAVRVVYC